MTTSLRDLRVWQAGMDLAERIVDQATRLSRQLHALRTALADRLANPQLANAKYVP
jgi:hypothetical protein